MKSNELVFKSRTFRQSLFVIVALALVGITLMSGCGKEKEIVVSRLEPQAVSLVYPPKDSVVTDVNPTFVWHPVAGAVRYQIQVAKLSDFVLKTINTTTVDTTYTTLHSLSNSTYYWRVKAQNGDSLWSSWADADIWLFYQSDYVNYINPIAELPTYGVPQDLYIRGDTAYVADGQACLTVVDISDPANPSIIRNLVGINDDFAKGVYVAEADTAPYAFVADMDGKVQALNIRDTTYVLYDTQIGASQNLEDLDADIINDTLVMFTVSSGSQSKMSCFQLILDDAGIPQNPGPVFEYQLSTDANGVYSNPPYVYLANGSSGMKILDISGFQNNTFLLVGWARLTGEALSVDVQGNYAYVACDRAGLYVVDISDKSNPDTVAHITETTGRAKDVQAVGNYLFMADAAGGLKVIDISVPESAYVVSSYPTPYAYGVCVDSDASHVYLCDRDRSLLIFENRTSR